VVLSRSSVTVRKWSFIVVDGQIRPNALLVAKNGSPVVRRWTRGVFAGRDWPRSGWCRARSVSLGGGSRKKIPAEKVSGLFARFVDFVGKNARPEIFVISFPKVLATG